MGSVEASTSKPDCCHLACLPKDLLPALLLPLPLSSLAVFAATSRPSVAAFKSCPVEQWALLLEHHTGIRVSIASPAEKSEDQDQALLPLELRFWSMLMRASRECQAVWLRPTQPWSFASEGQLKAARGMAEDAMHLLKDLSNAVESWRRRMPWWPPYGLQRLTFHGAPKQCMSAELDGQVVWEAQEQMWVREHPITCQLRMRCLCRAASERDDMTTPWVLDFSVLLASSGFPLYARGVHKAVIVHVFCSTEHCRLQAPRCTSYTGNDGSVVLGKGDKEWAERVLSSGTLNAIAVTDCVEFMM
eukprot:CAMPEP_0178417044 /NCGR_PEP_ID=MMETSP0689_2-20121128/24375_1 /TAXON_ID=160604 /ORGANISM="Amphidinium massartii, Strain CS-259" /LENGTH=302 /DNA_ID=CAMNT_0020038405 /DNA_START=58 /DNA_END=966 /DNA_ORIENTATION=+